MQKLMKVWDLLTIILLSVLLALIIWLFPESILRKVVGLPFILFFPGYSFVSFLFPEQRDLDSIERVALSFGMSVAIVPLVGLALNYTPFGITLTPILLSLISFNIIFSLLSVYRRINSREPFVPRVEIKFELGRTDWTEF